MKRMLPIFAALILLGCKNLPKKPTMTWADTTGIGIKHDPSVENPPEAHQDKKEEKQEIPPGSKVTRTETAATEDKPATTVTVVELPKDKGMDLSTTNTKTDLVGSKGYAPEKGPTPAEKATAGWMWGGVAMAALGIFFCTPWGGVNYRVGALFVAGGVGMSIAAKLIDQIKIPGPAGFLVFIGLAVAVYYGYQVRHKQITRLTAPPTT